MEDTFANESNFAFVRQRLLNLLASSEIRLPRPRRLALCETVRQAESGAELLDMILEALGDSFYVPDAIKDELVSHLLQGEWEQVQDTVCGRAQGPRHNAGPIEFRSFQSMATSLFYASRKIRQLPLERRRQLGTAILQTRTREQLVDLLLYSLHNAQTLDDDARVKIANDVLERRYYRLLKTDRFDCCEDDDTGTQHNLEAAADANQGAARARPPALSSLAVINAETVWLDEDTNECSICLSSIRDEMKLQSCRHSFCRDCLMDWAHNDFSSRHGLVSCPICRQESTPPSPAGPATLHPPTPVPSSSQAETHP